MSSGSLEVTETTTVEVLVDTSSIGVSRQIWVRFVQLGSYESYWPVHNSLGHLRVDTSIHLVAHTSGGGILIYTL